MNRSATGTSADRLVHLLLRRAKILRVATASASGAPIIAPVWFGYDGERIMVTMPESATVRNVQRAGLATAVVDEGSGYTGLRGAIIETSARAYRDDEAPEAIQAAARDADTRYQDERAELRAVRDAVRQMPAEEELAIYRLVLLPVRARWFTLGGGITGTVVFGAHDGSRGTVVDG